MSSLTTRRNAAKDFRRKGEEWRALAKAKRIELKRLDKNRAPGGVDYDLRRLINRLEIESDIYEALGCELKEMASDLLHGRNSVL